MKKSYFMRTFRLNGSLLFISVLLLVADIGFKLLGLFLQGQGNISMVKYTQFLYKYVMIIQHGLQQVLIVSILITFVVTLPELITRCMKDSVVNIGRSIWLTSRIRKFLQMRVTHEEEENKIFKYNKAVSKAIIDVRNDSVMFLIKVPNDFGIRSMIKDNQDFIREDVAHRLTEYSFSNVIRDKNYIRLEGTRIR
ncbi:MULTISPECIES: hypothetical protein [Enterococcus]|uniref:hypothetical protein n=1 Tax=Enterococcus TaxID=1350 RepID=UPI000CF03E5E|nr:hypothetical protein [Enterococcus faecalis]EGO8580240.1 hypothetical protein [Enterococcus faecalis]EGO8957500.1 hypothetical protein [Enterococcus faecalis]EGO9469056.1 hypothetical protein [Enterococcus faecalis]EGS1164793.1 hypothetical protein [Enterococcus faecalis]EGS1178866.1 hypothetical protein [Enterococcus faecalis]